MSNLKLGIFDNLAGYLTAATTECSGGVDNCGSDDKTYNRYYMQKYYAPKPHMARDEDVAAPFTNAVVALGMKIRGYDVSTGASPSLKKILLDCISLNVEKLTVGVPLTPATATADLTGDVEGKLSTANEVSDLKLANPTAFIGLLTDDVAKSPMSDVDKANADIQLKKLKFDDVATTFKLTRLATVDAVAEGKAIKDKLKEKLNELLTKWVADNYSVDTITGESSKDSATVLTALKSGNVLENELFLFNEFFDVMKLSSDGTWAPCSISDIDLANLKSFRINTKLEDVDLGTGVGKVKVPKIANFLPILKSGRIWYNKDNQQSNSNPFILRALLYAGYTNTVATILPDFNSSKGSTDLQLDMELLMRDIILRSTTPDAHVSETDTENIAEALKGSWIRVGENTWKHKLPDGTVVTIKPNTPEFDEEISKEVSNCASIGFSTDPVQCAAFLRNVALENHEQLAQVALQMGDKVAAETVAQIHPRFALAILKAFGFRRKVCKDKVAGRQLEKMQRVQEWIDKFVDKKFKDAKTVKEIKNNDKLKHFLDLLAQLVNSNPSILNDGLVVETEEASGTVVVPADLALRKIAPAQSKKSGKPVLAWGDIQSNMNKVYGSFSKGLTFDGMTTNSPFGMTNLFPQMSMFTGSHVVGSTYGSMGGGMKGGMKGGENDIKVFLQDHQTGLEYSRNVQKIIFELVENLKRNSNKTLSEDEIKSIGKKLKDFEMLERDLFETAWNIQKYSQLLKVVEAENRPEIITVAHVEKYVSKYNHLLGRYDKTGSSFNTLISLLKDCCDGGEESGENCKTL